MPIVPMSALLHSAQREGCAVGYFEAWDQYSLEAVLEAAEELDAPVILGFGGMFVNAPWFGRLGLPALGAMGHAIASRARVPVSLLLNEVETFALAMQGIHYGFNAVMLRSSHLPLAENTAITRRVVEVAHAVGVTVESEMDELPDATLEGTAAAQHTSLTDPEQARLFVQETGIDALAVSVGNVHMMLGQEAQIDFGRIQAIHQATQVPLVIHGGTGFPAEAVPQAIAAGVAKFNVGTILRKAFLDGIREGVDAPRPDANLGKAIGSRLATDVLVAAKERMKTEVALRIRLYGGAGRAAGTKQ